MNEEWKAFDKWAFLFWSMVFLPFVILIDDVQGWANQDRLHLMGGGPFWDKDLFTLDKLLPDFVIEILDKH